MRILYTTILVVIIGASLVAQSSRICGAILPSAFDPRSHYDLDPVDGKSQKVRKLDRGTNNSKLVFQLQFHLIRSSRGVETISDDKFQLAVENLNSAFYGADIQFKVSRREVQDDSFQPFAKAHEAEIHRKCAKELVINVYCVEDLDLALDASDPKTFIGYTYHPDDPDLDDYQRDMVIITYSGLKEQTTLIHELGHFFGLYHTHEFSKDPNKMEYVSRYECDKRGDGLCDTPADPDISGYVDANRDVENCTCDLGGHQDPFGDEYAPSIENFMSYAPPLCRTSFSPGQLNRMKRYALTKRRYL
ncbi:MAG: hypothetical protein KDC44_13600, partial [Phaeodactylibacter sp.]|nr:hypothetical protein [Phaeodactylibacter sp.]